ncbi:hypothetical protein GS551_18750 [Rhodococcus hoagii]|uniref:Uncharacterized protein n=1 Tax=Rhodococcus hoagii TaxID=43767 RepID=A0AAE3BBS6_RHOHA|nr:hypothetical protein [Prescottella equi]
MHDKNTAETLEEAIARLTALLEGRYWSMRHSEVVYGGWLVRASMPLSATHPSSTLNGLWIDASGPNLAPLVTDVANKVAEALAMRGAA